MEASNAPTAYNFTLTQLVCRVCSTWSTPVKRLHPMCSKSTSSTSPTVLHLVNSMHTMCAPLMHTFTLKGVQLEGLAASGLQHTGAAGHHCRCCHAQT